MYYNEDTCIPKRIIHLCLVAFTVIIFLFNIVNEYNYSNYIKELRPIINNAIPVSCIPLEENNGKIVHINCPLQDLQTFYPPPEFSSNLYSFKGIFFETKIEMFQWVRDNKNLGLYTRATFLDHIVPTPYNFLFFFKRKRNPLYIPTIGNIGRQYANYIKVGSYRIPKNTLINFQKKKKLDLIDDGWFNESEIKPPFKIDYMNTRVFNNYLYTGDPFNPKIGDIRISFYGNDSTHATVIGIQNSKLMNTIFELEGINLMNKKIILVSEDNKTMHKQVEDYINNNYGNITSLWIIRIICFLLMGLQVFYFLENDPRNNCWKLAVSTIVSTIIITMFPCIFWFFCDAVTFLSLFIFIFFLMIALLFLNNIDIDDSHVEMKNYMNRSVNGQTNYTFLNLHEQNDEACNNYDLNINENNSMFGSNNDISFSRHLNNINEIQPEPSV